MAHLDHTARIGFVGAGAVGGSLAVALSKQGYRVVAVASRSRSSAESLAARLPGSLPHATGQEVAEDSDVVFLTTPDDAVRPVASSISWRRGQAAVHCSGVRSLDVLDPVAGQEALRGAFHPLQQFADIDNGSKSFPGITFGIEADEGLGGFLGGGGPFDRGPPRVSKPRGQATLSHHRRADGKLALHVHGQRRHGLGVPSARTGPGGSNRCCR